MAARNLNHPAFCTVIRQPIQRRDDGRDVCRIDGGYGVNEFLQLNPRDGLIPPFRVAVTGTGSGLFYLVHRSERGVPFAPVGEGGGAAASDFALSLIRPAGLIILTPARVRLS